MTFPGRCRAVALMSVAMLWPAPASPAADGRDPRSGDPDIELFNRYDRNHDGVISEEEWKGDRREFREIDVNYDRVITLYEFLLRGTAADREQRFRRWDRNGDGKLEPGEWPGPPEVFSDLDRDRDGAVSLEEFLNTPLVPLKTGNSDPKSASDLPPRFRSMDRDHDGRISFSEWLGGAEEFRRLDRDNDGFLTPDELARR